MSVNEFEIEWDLKVNEFEIEMKHIQEIYPELEDLEVTPSATEQNFKSSKYGYDNVTVKAVESEKLNVEPIEKEQEFIGMYNKVNVGKINAIEVRPTLDFSDQYNNEIINENGYLKKVTISRPKNLSPEYIVKDIEICGVKGISQTADFKITDATALFYQGTRLNILEKLLALCDKVTSTSNMFYTSRNSVTIDISTLDMSNSTSMAYMFYTCSNLKTIVIDRFNTPKVTTLSYAFVNCSNLESLPDIDCSSVNIIANAFNNCSKLTNLGELQNLGKAYTQKTTNNTNYTLNLSPATKLTHDSLMNVINGLYDLNLSYKVASGGTLYTQTLNLGATNKNKLSVEEIATCTAKGWTVS